MIQYQEIIQKQDEIIRLTQKISTCNSIKEVKELGEELDTNIKVLKALKVVRIVQNKKR